MLACPSAEQLRAADGDFDVEVEHLELPLLPLRDGSRWALVCIRVCAGVWVCRCVRVRVRVCTCESG